MIKAKTIEINKPRKNPSLLLPELEERKKIKESMPSPNFPQVFISPLSHSHHQVPTQTTQTRKNQRLSSHGRRIH